MVMEQVDNDVTIGEDTKIRGKGCEDGKVKSQETVTPICIPGARQGLQACSVLSSGLGSDRNT